jgi:hypothetical protein
MKPTSTPRVAKPRAVKRNATCKVRVCNISTGVTEIGGAWYTFAEAQAHCRAMNNFDSDNVYTVWRPSAPRVDKHREIKRRAGLSRRDVTVHPLDWPKIREVEAELNSKREKMK